MGIVCRKPVPAARPRRSTGPHGGSVPPDAGRRGAPFRRGVRYLPAAGRRRPACAFSGCCSHREECVVNIAAHAGYVQPRRLAPPAHHSRESGLLDQPPATARRSITRPATPRRPGCCTSSSSRSCRSPARKRPSTIRTRRSRSSAMSTTS